jgi:ELWxxDGT repeat protein
MPPRTTTEEESSMSLRPTFLVALLCLLTARTALQAQPASLVRDINAAQPPRQLWDQRAEMETSGGRVFFVVDDGVHGKELWENDGTPHVSHLVRDICPGACSSAPSSLTDVQGTLYFIAGDGVHGRELWRSDGTEAGTTLAVEFNYDPDDSVLTLSPIGGFWMFALVDVHGFGQELFLTDGTSFGTQAVVAVQTGPVAPAARVLGYSAPASGLVLYVFDDGTHGVEPWVWNKFNFQSTLLADVKPGTGSSIDPSYSPASSPQGADAIAAPWGGFLFTADDGVHGRELWTSDGTPGGTHLLKDIAAGAAGSFPLGLTAVNGIVYFTASGPEGAELWRTDGTAAGTRIVTDLYAGANGSSPQELTAVGNLLFFLAYDPTFGEQIFRSDGTAAGTARLQSQSGTPIHFGFSPPGYGRHGLSAVNGKLLFFADDSSGVVLWTTDGTNAGTVFGTVGDATSLQMADGYAVRGGDIYFRVGAQRQEIWKSDGTAPGTVRVQDAPAQTSSFFLDGGTPYGREAFTAFGGQLYFQADDQGAAGTGPHLWRSDGTAAGTTQVEAALWNPEEFRVLGSHLIFASNDQLWTTDGTPGGAQRLPAPSPAFNLTLAGGLLYYTAFDVTTGDVELFVSDGTQDGIADIVSTLAPGTGSNPQLLTPVGNKLFLQVTDGAGTELWVSDGTGSGTARVADLRPGAASSLPQNLTAVGGTLFFSAATDGAGRELWKSDGTAAGTVPVKDIQPGAASSIADSGLARTFAAPPGGPLFFAADDGVDGEELWKSDGTADGTVMVKDLTSNLIGSFPRSLTVVGSRVFFVADDGPHGRELWVSDGTADGTRLVKDVAPGYDSSFPSNLTADGSVLLFSAFDPDHGVELWRTDGTEVGTRRVSDIAPGPLSASPLGLTPVGANVYFAANDNTTGFELWAAPQSNLQATFGDVPTTFWAWRFIESLVHSGVTGGCGGGNFCPGAFVNRAQMAIFVLAARDGVAPPPATGDRFNDVPPGYWAGPWIEELAREGVVNGCSANPPLYCPDNLLTRAEMAILLTVARHETPPPATGTRFADVPANYWAARWIEQLAADGVTSGCGGGNYCPDQRITRGEMAVFLATAFHLPLP